jgi:1L-myo-inositol 1-phosphate cytidylyltransferase / CDP-L-myo-inositol myo-inositolphosphotransferase
MVPLALVLALDVAGADPAMRLAGLSLALRAVLTAQRAGAARVQLVTAAGRADLVSAVKADARVTAAVEHVEAGGALAIDEPCLLVRHDVVADAALYQALAAAPLDGAAAVVARRDGVALGPALVGPELGAAVMADPDAVLAGALADGRARPLDTAAWAESVRDAAGRRRAVDALFEACRKPVDGIVSRHINRHVSIFISKRLVDTPVTPNQTSVFTLLLGLVAAAFVARGGYANTLVGAALLQLDSIIDGVDGELARVRFQQSKVGAWLDNVSDDVTALAFWAGLTIGAAGVDQTGWLALAGWIAVGSHVLYVMLSYTEFVRNKNPSYFDMEWTDKTKTGLRAKVVELLLLVPRRDFFVLFCLAAAAAGVLPWMLPIIAIACVATLVAGVARNVRMVLRRRGGLRRPAH